ncbi:MAG: helix-turn-helix domain-containing protein [Candidatus Marinimicrobia bacterium]|nr:helix-turn-helix domain-containing protein [Candidatus Neomarinimicrobiota bacterium]
MIRLNLDKLENKQTPFIDRHMIMKMFGISRSTLRRWMLEEDLKYYKVNRRVFFKTDEFNEWIEKYRFKK